MSLLIFCVFTAESKAVISNVKVFDSVVPFQTQIAGQVTVSWETSISNQDSVICWDDDFLLQNDYFLAGSCLDGSGRKSDDKNHSRTISDLPEGTYWFVVKSGTTEIGGPYKLYVNKTQSVSTSSPLTTDGDVTATAQDPNDSAAAYIAGDFKYVGVSSGAGVILDKDGNTINGIPRITGGDVTAVSDDGLGGWFIGGNFTHVGGLPIKNVAHILADGGVDPIFNFNQGSAVGSGKINTLAIDRENGRLYVGGMFNTWNANPRDNLAILDYQTGALSAGTQFNNIKFSTPSEVKSILVDPRPNADPDSGVYITGSFETVKAAENVTIDPQQNLIERPFGGLVKLEHDGSFSCHEILPSGNSGCFIFSNIDNESPYASTLSINSIALIGNNTRLVVGGLFTTISYYTNPGSISKNFNSLALINPTYGAQSPYIYSNNSTPIGVDYPVNNDMSYINKVFIKDEYLYVSGYFDKIHLSNIDINSTSIAKIKINNLDDLNTWEPISGYSKFPKTIIEQNNVTSFIPINSQSLGNDTALFGDFSSYGSDSVSNEFALDSAGIKTNTYFTNGITDGTEIYADKSQRDDGYIFVGGDITLHSAIHTNGIARIKNNGQGFVADKDFIFKYKNINPSGSAGSRDGFLSLAVTNTHLYVGGLFTSPIASNLISIPLSNADIDTSFKPNPTGAIYTLKVDRSDNRKLWVGGDFSGFVNANCSLPCQKLARMNLSTAKIDVNFGSQFPSTIWDIEDDPWNNKGLYIANGKPSCVIAWISVDNPSAVDCTKDDLADLSSNTVISFSTGTFNGNKVIFFTTDEATDSQKRIKFLDENGYARIAGQVDNGSNQPSQGRFIAQTSEAIGNRVFIGGSFSKTDTTENPNLASFIPSENYVSQHGFSPTPNKSILSLTHLDNTLIAGGEFNKLENNYYSRGLAIFSIPQDTYNPYGKIEVTDTTDKSFYNDINKTIYISKVDTTDTTKPTFTLRSVGKDAYEQNKFTPYFSTGVIPGNIQKIGTGISIISGIKYSDTLENSLSLTCWQDIAKQNLTSINNLSVANINGLPSIPTDAKVCEWNGYILKPKIPALTPNLYIDQINADTKVIINNKVEKGFAGASSTNILPVSNNELSSNDNLLPIKVIANLGANPSTSSIKLLWQWGDETRIIDPYAFATTTITDKQTYNIDSSNSNGTGLLFLPFSDKSNNITNTKINLVVDSTSPKPSPNNQITSNPSSSGTTNNTKATLSVNLAEDRGDGTNSASGIASRKIYRQYVKIGKPASLFSGATCKPDTDPSFNSTELTPNTPLLPELSGNLSNVIEDTFSTAKNSTNQLLGDGCYRYMLETKDKVGNLIRSFTPNDNKWFIVDTGNPLTQIIQPVFQTVTEIVTGGTAIDTGSGVKKVEVNLYKKGSNTVLLTPCNTDVDDSFYDYDTGVINCQFNLSTIPTGDGIYELENVVTDYSNNRQSSTRQEIIVDLNDPFVSLTLSNESNSTYLDPLDSTKIWIDPSKPGNFTATVNTHDDINGTGTGINYVEFDSFNRWSTPANNILLYTPYNINTVVTPNLNQYKQNYSWTSDAANYPSPAGINVTVFDNAFIQHATKLTIDAQYDKDNPVGSLNYSIPKNGNPEITISNINDHSESGIKQWKVERLEVNDIKPVVPGTTEIDPTQDPYCPLDTASDWNLSTKTLLTDSNQTGVQEVSTYTTTDTNISTNKCYKYILTVEDNVSHLHVDKPSNILHTNSVSIKITRLPQNSLVTTVSEDLANNSLKQEKFIVEILQAPTGTNTVTVNLSSLKDSLSNDYQVLMSSDGTTFSNNLDILFTKESLQKTIYVSAVDDHIDEEDIHYTKINISANGDVYTGMSPVTYPISIIDNDTSNILISKYNLKAYENDTNGESYEVSLKTQPYSDVSISLLSSNPEQANISTNSLTFTRYNWNKPQTVTLQAIDDQVAEDPEDITITHTISTNTSDIKYRLLPETIIPAKIISDDIPSLSITQVLNRQIKEGTESNISIKLTSQPTPGKVVSVNASEITGVIESNKSVTFTNNNWNEYQELKINAKDNAIAENDKDLLINLKTAEDSDPPYNKLSETSVPITIKDDDILKISANLNDSNKVTADNKTETKITISANVFPSDQIIITPSNSLLKITPASIKLTQDHKTADFVLIAPTDITVSNTKINWSVTTSKTAPYKDASIPPTDISISIPDLLKREVREKDNLPTRTTPTPVPPTHNTSSSTLPIRPKIIKVPEKITSPPELVERSKATPKKPHKNTGIGRWIKNNKASTAAIGGAAVVGTAILGKALLAKGLFGSVKGNTLLFDLLTKMNLLIRRRSWIKRKGSKGIEVLHKKRKSSSKKNTHPSDLPLEDDFLENLEKRLRGYDIDDNAA